MPRRRERKEAEPANPNVVPSADTSETKYPNVTRKTTHKKKKVLVLCSKGVTTAFINLTQDFLKLMPHARKDAKFDKRAPISDISEICMLEGCRFCLYFEARKMKDLYMWVAAIGKHGPSVKFLVQQIKTMDDLRLTGNNLLGSRPLLSFDNVGPRTLSYHPSFSLEDLPPSPSSLLTFSHDVYTQLLCGAGYKFDTTQTTGLRRRCTLNAHSWAANVRLLGPQRCDNATPLSLPRLAAIDKPSLFS